MFYFFIDSNFFNITLVSFNDANSLSVLSKDTPEQLQSLLQELNSISDTSLREEAYTFVHSLSDCCITIDNLVEYFMIMDSYDAFESIFRQYYLFMYHREKLRLLSL
jgi:hypothetical protein